MNTEEIPVGLRYVWVAYSVRYPYLPIAVADTAKELAARIGVVDGTVKSAWARFQRGEVKSTCYHRVLLPHMDNTKERSNG